MSRSQQGVQERYRRALDALTQKLQQDRTVLAAIVYGSYSYDQVWEKSDIDLWIVMADDPKVRRYEDHCLTEETSSKSESKIRKRKLAITKNRGYKRGRDPSRGGI